MKLRISRTRKVGVGTGLAILVLGAATALAAAPKPGIHYQNQMGQGQLVNVITLTVAEDGTFTAVGYDPTCRDSAGSYKGFQITKPVDASNGKFSFDGKAINTSAEGPKKVKVHLKGKFTSSKHSKGSYTLEGCDGKTKFKTKWTLGG